MFSFPSLPPGQSCSACPDLDRHVVSSHREILAEIKHLRSEHDAVCQPGPEKGSTNPTLLAELRLLR